jgi:hypothetical protein
MAAPAVRPHGTGAFLFYPLREIRTMKSILDSRVVLLLILFAGGCIVGDELTTFTVHPDGSADLVVLRSNLRSTENGEKGEKELADYRTRFEAQADGDFARVREAGGQIVRTSWIREQPPYSNFARSHFPNAAALEKFWTMKDDENKPLITTRFQKDGLHRKLTIHVTVADEKDNSPAAPSDAGQIRQAYANGISETRFAVTNGAITSARGFTLAGDRQSALLNTNEISEFIRLGQGKTDLWLEWDVMP